MKLIILLGAVLGYVIGSIPFALVIGKVFYKTDVRQFGSGNLGGTNAGRVLGAKAGLAVIILDAVKSLILMGLLSMIDAEMALYAGAFAAIGHCFPLFANFKGGKAVATVFGFLLGLVLFITGYSTWPIFVVPFVVFLFTLRITKYVSFSAMFALTIAVAVTLILKVNLEVTLLVLLLTLFVIYRHKENIQRLLAKSERKVKIFDKKKES